MNPLIVLRDSFYFFRINLWAILRLCLPLVVCEALARELVARVNGPDASVMYDVAVGLLFYPLYTAALILFLDARTDGYEPKGRHLLGKALHLWPRFALMAAISTLLIMFGMWLFVLPGLYLMIKLSFSEYLLVLRNTTPLQAMRESFDLTKGKFWPILFTLLAIMIPLWLLDGLSAMAWADTQPTPVRLLVDSVNSFLQLLPTVVLFRLFMLMGKPD
ncbi:YciC family protein [Pseudomonas sp. RIT-PI-a]|uniref:YciC family protein n=1 Tax=Pseudomonas sp. RIT-PI-a TaxID=1681194 RepID=UPI0006761479|nr:YciC family protein [Pseudomonas sp. RIT-PI-a]KNC13764.1 membrane protein [Pseudomonas sp. RIT-PI-a]